MIPERRFRERLPSDPDDAVDPDFPNMVEVHSHIEHHGNYVPNPEYEKAIFAETIIHNCSQWAHGATCLICGKTL